MYTTIWQLAFSPVGFEQAVAVRFHIKSAVAVRFRITSPLASLRRWTTWAKGATSTVQPLAISRAPFVTAAFLSQA